VEYQEQHRHVLGEWATAKGLEFSMMDPTAIVNPTEPLLQNRVTSSGGDSIWCTGDPVHLSREAYRDLAMAVCDAHEGESMVGESASGSTGSGHAGSGSGSRSSANGSEKRRVPDAVVNVPGPPLPKRGRYTRRPVTAGWLRGEATSVRESMLKQVFDGEGDTEDGPAAAAASRDTGSSGAGVFLVAVGS
jgi:hypothetical protein